VRGWVEQALSITSPPSPSQHPEKTVEYAKRCDCGCRRYSQGYCNQCGKAWPTQTIEVPTTRVQKGATNPHKRLDYLVKIGRALSLLSSDEQAIYLQIYLLKGLGYRGTANEANRLRLGKEGNSEWHWTEWQVRRVCNAARARLNS